MKTLTAQIHEENFENSFNFLASRIHNNAKLKGFYDKPRSFGEFLMLTTSELSEALEWHRQGNPKSDHIPEFSGEEEELADAIIRIMDEAAHRNLNVAGALIAKMEFNLERPFMHGGKKL